MWPLDTNPKEPQTHYDLQREAPQIAQLTPRRYKRNESNWYLSKIPRTRKLRKLNTQCMFLTERPKCSLPSVQGICTVLHCRNCNSYLAQAMPKIIASKARQTATHLRRSNMLKLQRCVTDIVTKFEYPLRNKPKTLQRVQILSPTRNGIRNRNRICISVSKRLNDSLSRPRVSGIRVTVPGPKGPRAL